MNILFIGDIFASSGRRMVEEHLQRIIGEEKIGLAIANAENSAGGFGVTPNVAQELFGMGLEVLTTGNHVWDKREVYDFLPREPRLLRPANYAESLPGSGLWVGKARNGVACAVINLQGRVHMATIEDPFRKADELLQQIPSEVKSASWIFTLKRPVKRSPWGVPRRTRLGGHRNAHSHPTADTRVLPGGTAYQTDCGMTGPYESVIGVERQTVIHRFLTQLPVRFEAAKGWVELHAVIIDVDEESGRARGIRPLVER